MDDRTKDVEGTERPVQAVDASRRGWIAALGAAGAALGASALAKCGVEGSSPSAADNLTANAIQTLTTGSNIAWVNGFRDLVGRGVE